MCVFIFSIAWILKVTFLLSISILGTLWLIRECVLLDTGSLKLIETCFMAYNMVDFCKCFICAFKKAISLVLLLQYSILLFSSNPLYTYWLLFCMSNLSMMERGMLISPTMMLSLLLSLGQPMFAVCIVALYSHKRLVRPKEWSGGQEHDCFSVSNSPRLFGKERYG